MRLNKIIRRYFEKGNVCVTGLRGTGKDVLFGNVIARRKLPYISNVDYGYLHIPLNLADLDCGKNTYKDFQSGQLKRYVFPHPHDTDAYISDCGIYFPSQYHKELNKDTPYFPTYLALSRQVSHNNVHANVQQLTRCWDKLREQSDLFIRCNWCVVKLGVVFMSITTYDNAESCANAVKPCPIRPKGLNRDRRLQARLFQESYRASHGNIKSHLLVFRNLSCHDTYQFEEMLKNAK